jgi:diguanylate cyclase (GGDEF)-like protein
MIRTPDLTVTTLVDRVNGLELELARLRGESETDALTGLGNRRMLDRRRSEGYYLVVDLDGFKAAQDHHPLGHQYGDQVLREFSDYLRGVCRADDSVVLARTGGDEFTINVHNIQAAERLETAVHCWRSRDGKVSASCGIGRDTTSADAAMYHDKDRRRRERI